MKGGRRLPISCLLARVAQLAEAPGLGPGGWGFESPVGYRRCIPIGRGCRSRACHVQVRILSPATGEVSPALAGFRGVIQRSEGVPWEHEVRGSNPLTPIKIRSAMCPRASVRSFAFRRIVRYVAIQEALLTGYVVRHIRRGSYALWAQAGSSVSTSKYHAGNAGQISHRLHFAPVAGFAEQGADPVRLPHGYLYREETTRLHE